MKAMQLGGLWNVQDLSGHSAPYVCTLPGYIHRDPLPFSEGQRASCFLESGWELSRTFHISDCSSMGDALLLLSHVYGEADLFMNGHVIGGIAHTLRAYRFPVGSFLVSGENRISMMFHDYEQQHSMNIGVIGTIALVKQAFHHSTTEQAQQPFTRTVVLPNLQPSYPREQGRTSGTISVTGLVADTLR